MSNRTSYTDHGVVFAREHRDLCDHGGDLGLPLPRLGARDFYRLVKQAGVRRITPHGLRHTMATLLLSSGKPVSVVSERLGHAKVSMTYDVYSHVIPGQQRDAAETMGALLH
jgi:integrase